MLRSFDQDLSALKTRILLMGEKVKRAVFTAIRALNDRDPLILDEVFELEESINRHHLELDETCLTILARQSPLASDLRLVIAITKINTDLERMGDQAVNIAHNCKHYLSGQAIKPLIDIPKMTDAVIAMVEDSLKAFVNGDLKLAKEILGRDDVVDEYKNKIFQELKVLMKENPETIERSLDLILIARNLERLGDHSTNIAEDVIFAYSGQDVRHSGSKTAAQ